MTAIAATLELNALFEIDKTHRKTAWHHRLMNCLPHALFHSGEPEIIFNKAGLTYFNLQLSHTAEPERNDKTTYSIPELIDSFLIAEGTGIAIEARNPKQAIDMSYGDILGFHLHRTFAEPAKHLFQSDKPRAQVISADAEVLINDVPPEILPTVSLKLLQEIMRHFGVDEPSIKWLYLPETEQNELVFSIKPALFTAEQTQALMKRLGWFLPRYYSYLACDID